MNGALIHIDSLTKTFPGGTTALKNISLDLKKGETHCIVGSNGAGKTTLFLTLLGILGADSGESFLFGEDSQGLSPANRGRIAYVNDEHALPGWMTAQQLLNYQYSFYRERWNQSVFDQIINSFDMVADQKISSLSRGERAGLNLALALAQSPDLLILDEPTLGLDVVSKRLILDALLFSSGDNDTDSDTTIVYSSHQIDEIERIADNLIIMERGEVSCITTPDEFLSRVSCWITESEELQFDASEFPGVLSIKTIGKQQHVFILDQDKETETRMMTLSESSARQSSVSLELAVNAFLSQKHGRSYKDKQMQSSDSVNNGSRH